MSAPRLYGQVASPAPARGGPTTTGGLVFFALCAGFATYGAARHSIWLVKNLVRHSPR